MLGLRKVFPKQACTAPSDKRTLNTMLLTMTANIIANPNISACVMPSFLDLSRCRTMHAAPVHATPMHNCQPQFGEINTNRSCRITPFFQHHVDQLDLTKSAVDFIFNKFKKGLISEHRPDEIIRNALGRFGMSGDIVDRPMSTLSGGQKSRVAFTVMTWKTPNFIIMDEPTNHLDMETIDALIGALNVWRGGLLIVSHDQHFLQSIAKQYWIVANKKIYVFQDFHEAKAFALEHHKVDL